MAVSREFRDFIMEQLEGLGRITPRPMFGGVGLYCDGLFFALLAEDQLFLKTDGQTQTAFADAGCEPFRPFGGDKPMSYWSAPLEALEDPDSLDRWARLALAAALRARSGKARARARP